MRPQEVVVGDKQRDEGDCTIDAVKPVGRSHMVLEGPVESFDQLLIGSVGFGLAV